MKTSVKRTLLALIPLAVLVVLLALDISIFGADSILGASQVALLAAAGVAIGLAILVFGFGLKPGTPPTDVIYIIIAAVTCAGTLQASGGMDWMIQIAERMLRKHPDHITFLGPLTTFFLTVLVGTGHVVYTIMPIICDIATVNFDRSGTTVIGKYLLNHSFMMPGLIHVVVATLVAYSLSMLIF